MDLKATAVTPELASAALECPELSAVLRLAAWVGDGRLLTDDGVLGPADVTQACAAVGIEVPSGAVDVAGLMYHWDVALWAGLITAFPDLSNTVHAITSNDDGDVVAQVDIEGTQQLAWGLITPAGRHYLEPHLFIFHVGPDLLIDSITAYWNDAGISQQLGHNEVD